MAKRINFVAFLVIALLAENIFAFDNIRDRHFHHYTHPRFRPAAYPQQIITPPMPIQTNVVTVWLTNNNGSKTEVKLTITAAGYIGPKGEYYQAMPTEDQLKPLYGVYSPPPVRNNIIFYLGKIDGVEKIVVITRDGDTYLGPNGERYMTIPTEQQLRLVYVTPALTGIYVSAAQ
jgi:hypothetical protein